MWSQAKSGDPRSSQAAAALADFGRYSRAESVNAGGIFDWQSAALRLAAELGSLLDQLGAETPGPAAGLLDATREVVDEYDAGDLGARTAMERTALIAFGDER